jgi:TetR/AcrR family transcriptional regulator, transcriptional repressor for nem operon
VLVTGDDVGRLRACCAETDECQLRGTEPLEARSDPAVQDSMAVRRERLTAAGVADLKAMGWDDAEAAAQLLAAMTREISVLEFDAGRRLPASRRALKRFLGT